MTIKLNQKTYAHGFCLLFHNMWVVNQVCSENRNET